jgi:hypothetical protein
MGSLEEPSEIAGRYQIGEKLGEGAFGKVCRAKDTVLGRMVAIKTVRLEGLAAAGTQLSELMERFRREAQVAAQLKHPNIVTIYDIGEDAGLNYIAMEYIDGQGLDALIRRSGRLPLERAVAIGIQVAEALDYAHRHGVVHRDIKPANVMLEAEDHVKVTDFGIAKPLDASEQLTATGSLLGTPAYMSPEQARGEKLDGRSDLFSLGCILYEMVTGGRAFQGDSITSLLLKIVTEEPRPLREVDPSLPEPFAALVSRALCKDREARYPSGKELARDLAGLHSVTTISELETLGAGRAEPAPALPTLVPSPPPTVAVAPTQVAAATPPEVAGTPPASAPTGAVARKRSPVPVLLGTVGVLLAAIGLLSWRVLSRSAEPGTEEGSPALARAEARDVAGDEPATASLREAHQALETLGRLADRGRGATSETNASSDLDEAQDALEGLGALLQQANDLSGHTKVEETVAQAGLTAVFAAEEIFRAETGHYGTLPEIAERLQALGGDLGDLELRGDHGEAGGVRYTVRLTNEGFEAEAAPLAAGSATYVTDQTGSIRRRPPKR